MQLVQQEFKVFVNFSLNKLQKFVQFFLWDTKTFANYDKKTHGVSRCFFKIKLKAKIR